MIKTNRDDSACLNYSREPAVVSARIPSDFMFVFGKVFPLKLTARLISTPSLQCLSGYADFALIQLKFSQS